MGRAAGTAARATALRGLLMSPHREWQPKVLSRVNPTQISLRDPCDTLGKELSLPDYRAGCTVAVVRRSLTILLVFLFAMQLGPACGFATVVTPDSMNCCQTKCPLESSQHHSGCCQVSATSDKAVAQVGIAPGGAPLSASVGSVVPAPSPANGLRLLTYRSAAPPPQLVLDLLCSRQL